YRFTDGSLDALRDAGVPAKVLKKLQPFGKRPFSKHRLQTVLGDEDMEEYGDKVMDRAEKEQRIGGATVKVFGAPPIDGLGTTGGFKLIVEDRGNLGLPELQNVGGRIVGRGNKTDELRGLFSGSGANTPWLYLEIDRDK